MRLLSLLRLCFDFQLLCSIIDRTFALLFRLILVLGGLDSAIAVAFHSFLCFLELIEWLSIKHHDLVVRTQDELQQVLKGS